MPISVFHTSLSQKSKHRIIRCLLLNYRAVLMIYFIFQCLVPNETWQGAEGLTPPGKLFSHLQMDFLFWQIQYLANCNLHSLWIKVKRIPWQPSRSRLLSSMNQRSKRGPLTALAAADTKNSRDFLIRNLGSQNYVLRDVAKCAGMEGDSANKAAC